MQKLDVHVEVKINVAACIGAIAVILGLLLR